MNENQCEQCGVEMAPFEADAAYDRTFQAGDGGYVFCPKHLDEWVRNMESLRETAKLFSGGE